ncbi:MAG: TIGR03960 family B12-binding radical SAM protein [Lachnospiraceae bacterium]|nr:TIGR03960 family B12-binding radical SAM protein [Lachnospiraceae bacterium]
MRKLALSDDILLSIEKPARYIGNEINMVKKNLEDIDIRFCMCFPDVYEIGMSHLGIQILYDMFNRRDDIYCERVYSPWPDLDKIMREKNIPLFALESQDPVKDFDFLGITLQYEMCYTNILQILDLSGIPLIAADRTAEDPFVIGGGPCSYNPEPITDFFDMFYIGDGETVYYELMDIYKDSRSKNENRIEFLKRAANVPGIYVPMFYEAEYNDDNTLKSFKPNTDGVPETIVKQVVSDLTDTFYPEKPIVPFMKVTQDRVVLEIQRGCIRGCRFCQAGMLYRPTRPRKVEKLIEYADKMLKSTGQEEITLSSLSSSDYNDLKELVYFLIDNYSKKGVNVALPSLRIDAFSLDVMSKVQDIKKSSLTFAPEAGSQRMRNVINKGLTEEEILNGALEAFLGGWNRVKLYFMLGLPFEEYEDIEQIAVLADKIARLYYDNIPKEKRNGKVQIVASSSIFVPKPFTPFQWARMNSKDEARDKRDFLRSKVREQLNQKSIKYNCHDAFTSELEGVLARGDRRLNEVVLKAYQKGAIFDAWVDFFDYDKWDESFKECGIDMKFYIDRERAEDELFPWDFIDAGVTKQFLLDEYRKSKEMTVTPNCREKCSGCGIMKFKCKDSVCYEARS